jgi:hypothetical protein
MSATGESELYGVLPHDANALIGGATPQDMTSEKKARATEEQRGTTPRDSGRTTGSPPGMPTKGTSSGSGQASASDGE